MTTHPIISRIAHRLITAIALLLLALACPGQSSEDSTTDFRKRGNQALEDGIYSASVRFFTHYRQAVGLKEPELADATALLVEALYREGKFSEAAAALDWYRQNSPGVTDLYYNDLILYWQAVLRLKTGDTDAPMKTVDQLLERHKTPDDIRVAALVLKGEIHARERQWLPAEQAFKTAVKEFSEDPADQGHVSRAKLGLADVFKQSGRTEEAIALLNQMAEDPALPTATRTRARLQIIGVHISRNELTEALTLYTTIEPQRPRIANAVWFACLSELFNALAKNGSPDLALSLVPGLTATAPDNESRLSTRVEACKLLMLVGKLSEAGERLDDLTDARGINPAEIANLQLKLADLYEKNNRKDLGINLFRQIIGRETVPKDIRFKAASNLGSTLMSKEDFDAGGKAFVEAARLAGTRAQQARALFSAGEASLEKAKSSHDDSAGRRLDYSKAANFFKNVADNFPETSPAPTAMFKLALAKSRIEEYVQAASILGEFLETYPDQAFWDQAALLRIRCLKEAGEHEKTAQAVNAFIQQKPDSPLAPAALMEGFKAARQAGDYPQANGFLSAIVDNEKKYARSGLPPHALYERIHLHFLYGKNAAALADCETFFKKYGQLPLAADVHLWKGDYHFSAARQQTEKKPAEERSDYMRALEGYLAVIRRHPKTAAARRALFESARIHYYLKDFSKARKYLTQLIGQLSPSDPSRLHGMAYLQLGEILSEAGQYAAALEAFQKAREPIVNSDNIMITSMGREADMCVTLAGTEGIDAEERNKHLSNAAGLFAEIAQKAPPSSESRAEAWFKLGKIWEMKGDEEKAIENYLTVSYAYEDAVKNGAIRDWHYYPRAVFAAGKILERQGKYEQALRCYQRLVKSKLPAAIEAAAKVREMKELTRR